MGCCFSSTTTKNPTQPTNHSLSPPKPPDHDDDDNHHHHQPPQPSKSTPEEETVKEVVLSETPVLAAKPIIPQQTLTPLMSKPIEQQQEDPKTNQPQPQPQLQLQEPQPESEAVSEYSDVCSFSGSVSTATTVTEKRENEVTSRDHNRDNVNGSSYAYSNNKRRLHGRSKNGSSPVKTGLQRKRPYASGGGEKRGRVGGSKSGSFSSAQKSAPSPEGSGKVGTGVRGRGMVQGRNGGERVNDSGGMRRVSGEMSCRGRSSSPATGRDGGVGRGGVRRSPAKRIGSTGSRSRELSEGNSTTSDEVDAKKDLSLGSEEKKKEKIMEGNGGVSENGNESIDNPLVSLECFIFL